MVFSTDSKLVSVVIPLYNGEGVIKETINSVLNQTFKNLEVIVIDDGSTDKSCEVVKSFGPSVHGFSCVNGGVAKARNFGIAQASGKYIALLDHDDLWDSTKLEKQVQILEANPDVGMVVTDIIHINGEGKSTGEYAFGFNERDEFYKVFVGGYVPTPSSVIIRKRILDELGGFDERFSSAGMDDQELWARIGASCKIAVVKESLTFHRESKPKPSEVGLEHRMLLNELLFERFGKVPEKRGYLMKEKAAYLNDVGKRLIAEGNVEKGRTALRDCMGLCVKEGGNLKVLFRSMCRYFRSFNPYSIVESRKNDYKSFLFPF